MAYTDNETRKDWKVLDKKALNEWADEFEVSPDEVHFEIENIGADKDDINSHIYGVLCIAGYNYMNSIREYCEENDINLTNTQLDENANNYKNDMDILNIYTNYLDSGFDSELSDLVTVNPDEENILEALEILGIDINNKKSEESLFEVTFYKQDSEEVFDKMNIYANNEEHAVELLIELDRDKDEPQGLEDLKYLVRDYNDDSLLQNMVEDFENSQQSGANSQKEENSSNKKIKRDR